MAKTAKGAMLLLAQVQAYEAAGAFALEIEVVPDAVATEISERVGILLWSMGADAGCDAQYLFAEDILGQNRGHMPRHSKVYRDFAAEYDRLQSERIAAFSEYVTDVAEGSYLQDSHLVKMADAKLAQFHEMLANRYSWDKTSPLAPLLETVDCPRHSR